MSQPALADYKTFYDQFDVADLGRPNLAMRGLLREGAIPHHNEFCLRLLTVSAQAI
jgi:hypothetical protein